MSLHTIHFEDQAILKDHNAALAQGLSHAEDTLHFLQGLAKTLPVFQQIQTIDINVFLPIVQTFSRFKEIIVLGTGGSSLGGRSLYELAEKRSPKLHFYDNVDPHSFEQLFGKIDPKETGVIAISKSGNTAETLMQLLSCITNWQQYVSATNIKDHFLVVAENKSNGIREVAHHYNLPCLDHPDDIGGRFAVMTVVGLLPALLTGLDVSLLLEGAQQCLKDLQTQNCGIDNPAVRGAVVATSLANQGYNQTVMMPYLDRLRSFAGWYSQLWAESLGKEGKGTTPLPAVGTVDQHSQLQLFLDGPRNKLFTIITASHQTMLPALDTSSFKHPSLTIFHHKTIGDLMFAEQQATVKTLQNKGLPVRVIHFNQLNEYVMGYLMTHFFLETLATAHIMQINPFDQPAVEESKILTRDYLTLTS